MALEFAVQMGKSGLAARLDDLEAYVAALQDLRFASDDADILAIETRLGAIASTLAQRRAN